MKLIATISRICEHSPQCNHRDIHHKHNAPIHAATPFARRELLLSGSSQLTIERIAVRTRITRMSNENVERVRKLIRKVEKFNIDVTTLSAIRESPAFRLPWKSILLGVGLLLTIIVTTCTWQSIHSANCLISMPNALSHAFRKPESCDFCRNISEIVRIDNIPPDEFERQFAYTARPVIITDATINWTASQVFDFWYFQHLYRTAEASGDTTATNCQFFPYKTTFKSLREALSMPNERVNYASDTEPWYFGWSNCNYEIAQQLRHHYGRPYFLPETSENAATDWIFMGGPGLGAHMHVDNVRLPSWQAQIKGSKQWTLAPPPECYYQCSTFSAIVRTGEIVILDTNKWYHMTEVLPGELSITIGAEYD